MSTSQNISSNGRWEHFSHQADIGLRGCGESKETAFEQIALALAAVMISPEDVKDQEKVVIQCQAPNDELLLADWLNALIFETSAHQWLFSRFRVRICDHTLYGEAWGEPINPEKHPLGVEVKGATYTSLSVKKTPEGYWQAQCVVDV